MDWRDFSRSANMEDHRPFTPFYVPELQSGVVPSMLVNSILQLIGQGGVAPPTTPLGTQAGYMDAGTYHHPMPLDTLLSPVMLAGLLRRGLQ